MPVRSTADVPDATEGLWMKPNEYPYPDIVVNMPDLSGKVVVVTGANTGVGFWVAHACYNNGATVVMACRNKEKALKAKGAIEPLPWHGRYPQIPEPLKSGVPTVDIDNHRQPVGGELIVPEKPCDLADFASVRAFAEEVSGRFTTIQLLVCNGAIMGVTPEDTKDGYNNQMQTNHLSHFLLAALLKPNILAAKDADTSKIMPRIVTVCSDAQMAEPPLGKYKKELKQQTMSDDKPVNAFKSNHQPCKSSVMDCSLTGCLRRCCIFPCCCCGCLWGGFCNDSMWESWNWYGASKAANVRMAREIHRRETGNIEATTVHPGLCATQLQRRSYEGHGMSKFMFDSMLHKNEAHSVQDGASLVLTACFSAASGSIVAPKGLGTRGPLTVTTLDEKKSLAVKPTKDEEMNKLLWDATEKAVGAKF